jgi:hypothetical protein
MNLKFYIALAFLTLSLLTSAQVVKVEVKQDVKGNWSLYRGGQPYYVRGGGGSVHMDKLVEIGGNSIRTWGIENAKSILDEAQKHGLTVMMGLWMQHERHGFDYDDKQKVREQLENFKKVVTEIKDHPALLLWGVGNEVDLNYTNTNVWYAVNDIAKMIHELDPNHPTCTVTAGLDSNEVALVKQRAPEIDLYGINTYGDLGNVKNSIGRFGWTGPYLITEWGPNGHWEVARTKWGASVEQSSTEKADSYEERYKNDIAGDAEHCMGSYVFLWGQKQETTSTWYGLFSENGESSEALDRLQLEWTGKQPSNSCPKLISAEINGKKKGDFITFSNGEKFEALAKTTDVDGDKLKVLWQVIPESTDIRSGGDAESAPVALRGCVVKNKGEQAIIRAPEQEGAYRLFLTITDGHQHYAYTNIPFYVMPNENGGTPNKAVSFKKMALHE